MNDDSKTDGWTSNDVRWKEGILLSLGLRVSRRPRGSTTEFAQESLFAHTAQRTKNDKERTEFYSTIFTI